MEWKDRAEFEEQEHFLDSMRRKANRLLRENKDHYNDEKLRQTFICAFEQGAIEAHEYLRKTL